MFGPDTELLSGRHVVFVDLGHAAALSAARELFAPTMAEQVVMSLDDHDRLIAYVLGLSHALNIAFFTALAESGEAAPKLARMSSTTFDAQLDVASRVAQESPELYYEIQSLNDYGAESLEALSQAVERIRTAVLSQDHGDIRRVDAPRTRLSRGPAQRHGAPRLRPARGSTSDTQTAIRTAGGGAARSAAGLAHEHRVLQGRLTSLTESVARNEALLRKTQERELELLRAGSLDAAASSG